MARFVSPSNTGTTHRHLTIHFCLFLSIQRNGVPDGFFGVLLTPPVRRVDMNTDEDNGIRADRGNTPNLFPHRFHAK